MIPIAAIIVAIVINSRNDTDKTAPSESRLSTSSHTTASAGDPGAAISAARATSETEASTASTAIDPSRSSPRSRSRRRT